MIVELLRAGQLCICNKEMQFKISFFAVHNPEVSEILIYLQAR